MLKKLFFVLLVSQLSYAQIIPADEPVKEKVLELEKPKAEWKDRLHYGGNIWLGFAGAFYMDAAPMVGYDLTGNGTVAGVGASLIYYGLRSYEGGGLTVGPRLFLRQKIWRTVFAHAEYELMNSSAYNFYDGASLNNPGSIDPLERRWGGTQFIGLGFYQNRMRAQSGPYISVLYNMGATKRGLIPQQRIDPDGYLVFRIGFFI